MKNALKDIFGGFVSLLVGMKITLVQAFKPTVTVQYPHQALKMPPRFRGHIELVRDPETGLAKCYACKLCERACPSDCIAVDGAKLEGAKKKSVTLYTLDFTKCSLCGACVEACRDACIEFSHSYNMAGLSKEEFVMDLFRKLEEDSKRPAPKSTPAPVVAAAPKVVEAPKTPAAAPAPAATPLVPGPGVDPAPATQKLPS
jgi:NADH-quinone oxidoreductase subunit I